MQSKWIPLSIVATITVVLIANGGWLLVAMLWNEVFGPKAPPIYRQAEIPKHADWKATGRAFDVVVRKRFPPGTPVTSMVSELKAEGFESPTKVTGTCRAEPRDINDSRPDCPAWDAKWDPKNQIGYYWSRGPCRYNLSIQWSADQAGRITSVQGSYADACL